MYAMRAFFVKAPHGLSLRMRNRKREPNVPRHGRLPLLYRLMRLGTVHRALYCRYTDTFMPTRRASIMSSAT